MRLHIRLSRNTKPVPFNYQHALVGTLHKWLGTNNVHDEVSLYSLSWLQGASVRGQGFDFPNGATMFVSAHDPEIIAAVVAGIDRDRSACYGMRVQEYTYQQAPHFGNRHRFVVSSPVLVRKFRQGGGIEHLPHDHEEADFWLTETLTTKLGRAGLPYSACARFDRSYRNAKTKLVTIKGIQNKANFCPVIIEGDAEALAFAWCVGVGHSTGCGFGALSGVRA